MYKIFEKVILLFINHTFEVLNVIKITLQFSFVFVIIK